MYLRIFLALFILFCGVCLPFESSAQSHSAEWKEAKNISGNFKAVVSQPDIEVFSSPNTVMLKVNHTVEVRLFSILGKLISTQKLSPGIYEFKLETHGIYVIKTEESSCKIAV